jgi:hypothetical protein
LALGFNGNYSSLEGRINLDHPCTIYTNVSAEISGSHGNEFGYDCLLGCWAVSSGRNWLTFQRIQTSSIGQLFPTVRFTYDQCFRNI